jgi:two-component system cell cycle sensor histidine kinase/response regulator CckA
VTVAQTHGATDHVLVVDDEPVIRRFASRVLAAEGFGVHEATDGESALRLILGGGVDPACVVSDVIMPRLNGVELLQTLSNDRPDLPVILMSGYATAELARRGIALPCGVLAKPFPPELLVSEVRRCIRRQLT